MLKIYQMTTNDGGWNGRITDFVIAHNEEEAIEKSQFYQDRRDSGCDHWIKEMTGQELISYLLRYNNDCSKYNIELTITEKEK